jgi:hypothetical protein
MPLELEAHILNPELSTHEGLRLEMSLHNGDGAPRDIPSPYDRSGSFEVGLFGEGPDPLRVMDRQTSQFMMTDGRVDSSLDIDTLAPGETWRWDMDLASYHYAIPPGDYAVRTVYAHPPEAIHVETAPQPVHVHRDPLRGVRAVRDNPILEGLTILFEAERGSRTEYFLRLHNYPHPLGAWWSAAILEGHGAMDPFVATANFYQTESSDPFHQKWVLWTPEEGRVVARMYDRGNATDHVRDAELPAGAVLLRHAIRGSAEEVYLFAWVRDHIQCYELSDRGLERLFTHRVPDGVSEVTPMAIAGDERFIHIVMGHRGILHDGVTYGGAAVHSNRLHTTNLHTYSIAYEPAERRIKAIFVDSPSGRMVQLAVADVESGIASVETIDRLPLHQDWRELSFDRDRAGRFHVAISTVEGRLYYYSGGRGPLLVAEGEERFFPIMVAPLKVFIGCYRRDYGYRFVQYQRRRRGSKIVGLGNHP